MSQNSFRGDLHRALDELERPVPSLHSRSIAAVRAHGVESVKRGTRFGWLAGAAAVLLALAIVGVFQLANGIPVGRPLDHPTVDSGVWTEDLNLTGDVHGPVTSTVANTGAVRSSCTGKTSKAIGKYSLQLTFRTDQGAWQFFVDVDPYQGPGTYMVTPDHPTSARALFANAGGGTVDWHSGADDPVVFTVDSTEEAGTVMATMSVYLSVPPGSAPPETITGRWTCRTSQ
jgi:hypothetical protein